MTGKTIFIADDDPQYLEFLRICCASQGHSVHTASTGKDIVRRIAELKPHLAILDLQLPTLDGLNVCRRLKADEATRSIPTMIVTAHASQQNWLQSVRSGADVFCPKPIGLDALARCVDALLHRISYKIQEGGRICVGGFVIDPKKHLIILNGREISGLTTKPFDLAYLLVQDRPDALSRREILRELRIPLVRENEVNVLAYLLRKSLGPLGKTLFKVARGRGYYFDESAAIRLGEVSVRLAQVTSGKPASR